MAIRPNPYFDPDFLIPAMRHLADEPIHVLIVTAQPQLNPSALPVFCGLMPIANMKTNSNRVKRSRNRFSQRNDSDFEIWQHEFCHDCTPLLRQEVAAETLDFMLDYLRCEMQIDNVTMNCVAAEGAFGSSLSRHLENHSSNVLHARQTTRHRQQAPSDQEQPPLPTIDLPQQLELLKKLSTRGEVKTTTAAPGDSDQWVDEFLRLEATSNRTSATAKTSSHSANRFLREMSSRMLAYGKMTLHKTTLSNQPIAMCCDMTHQHGPKTPTHAVRFKTAYLDSLERFIPILLPDLNSHETFGRPNVIDQFLDIRFSLHDPTTKTTIPTLQKLKQRFRKTFA